MKKKSVEDIDVLNDRKGKGFGVLSAGHIEELEDFNESASASMKLKRGFF